MEDQVTEYRRTIETIYNLTFGASEQNAFMICQSIAQIAKQSLQTPCAPDCRLAHSVARLARIEDVSTQYIYKLQSKGVLPKGSHVNHHEFRAVTNRLQLVGTE